LFFWWVCRCFRHISPRTYWIRSGGLVLERTSSSSSEAKGVLWGLWDFRSFFR
jgi:hypothetical protein